MSKKMRRVNVDAHQRSDWAHAIDEAVGLSIIIVSYNTRQMTLDCLDSVFRHPPSVPFEVILLDNASSDGSIEEVRRLFPQVIAIESRDNVGFAAGNNLAAQQAGGRRILLLNPDTIVLEGTLPAIWSFAEREPRRGIWGGRTLFPDMTLNPSSCWRRISLWSVFCITSGLTHLFLKSPIFNPEAFGSWPRDRQRDVDIVSGCFLLIDTELWHRLGGFDPLFFMYAEEADLCLRASALGFRPAITPEATLIHYGGASETSRTDKAIKILRGRTTLMRKHWTRPALAVGRGLLLAWSFSRLIVSRFVAGHFDEPGKSRAKWAEIWRRRSEWLAGY